MIATCYLIANSISCPRLFFGQISSAFFDHLKSFLNLFHHRTPTSREAQTNPLQKHSLKGLVKLIKRSLFYFISKISTNVYIILYCKIAITKCFNSPIKLLNSPLYYSSVKQVMLFCGFAHFLLHYFESARTSIVVGKIYC